MALPIVPIILGGVGLCVASKLLPKMCSHKEAITRFNQQIMEMFARLLAQTKRVTARKIDLGGPMKTRIAILDKRYDQLVKHMETVSATTAHTLGYSTIACEAQEKMNAWQAEAASVSAAVGAMIGEKPAVPSPSFATWSMCKKVAVAGAVAGGLYLGYHLWTSYRHGDDIPQQNLPRYAGGTR